MPGGDEDAGVGDGFQHGREPVLEWFSGYLQK
jgi:hypothetical protein